MEIKTTSKIKKIQTDKFFWIDIVNPGRPEIEFLQETFDFHPLDIEDIRQKTQRSKVDRYQKYIFTILLFPTYNKDTKEVEPSEVDFFLGPDYLITIHRDNMALFRKLYSLCQIDKNSKDKILGLSPEKLMYELLDRLYTYCFPMLDHISIELEEMEQRIFGGEERKMVKEILIARRNITDFRKIMQPHKKAMLRMVNGKNKGLFAIKGSEVYFDDLTDHAKEIWDSLEAFKESVEAMHETNEALISHKLNQTMKILTAVSVILLPTSVIAALWGMNVEVPFGGHENGFWIIAAIVTAVGVLCAFYFKFKKWL